MIASKKINSVGKISFDKKVIYEKLLKFIEEALVDFPEFFKENGAGLTKENDITQLLDTFLNLRVRETDLSMFLFKNQFNIPNNSRSSDIGVLVLHFSKRDPFFAIEAKRLPTPGSGREREYVQGNLGGMERFKRELHGKGHPFGAIIGYIQQHDCAHWLKAVNGWIDDLISNNKDETINWKAKDKLTEVKPAPTKKFESTNERNGTTPVTIFHYWIGLS